MRRSAARSVSVAVLTTLVMALPAMLGAAAQADDGSLRVTGAPLDISRLAPGTRDSGAIEVHNDSSYVTRLDLQAIDVAQAENSCEPPERRVPTEGCAADGGELGGWLVFSVSRDDPSHQVLWTGSLGELEAGATLTESMPAGADWPLRLGLELPFAATNDTMTDSISFGLRFVASSQEGVTDVSGPQVSAGGPGGTGQTDPVAQAVAAVQAPLTQGPQVSLPMTGTTISLWLLLLDLALLLAGGFLVVLLRRPAAPQRHTPRSP